jgi:hypothetical protein
MHPDSQVRILFYKEDYEAVFKEYLGHQCDLRMELKATTLMVILMIFVVLLMKTIIYHHRNNQKMLITHCKII